MTQIVILIIQLIASACISRLFITSTPTNFLINLTPIHTSDRPIYKMLSIFVQCPECVGFWVGLIYSFIYPQIIPPIAFAALTSPLTYLICEYFDNKSINI